MEKLYGNDDDQRIHVAVRELSGFGVVCEQSGEEDIQYFHNASDAEFRFNIVCDTLEQSGWRSMANLRLVKGPPRSDGSPEDPTVERFPT